MNNSHCGCPQNEQIASLDAYVCAIFKFRGYSYIHKHITKLDKKRDSHLDKTWLRML